MYPLLEIALFFSLAVPAILIDRSGICTGPAKSFWWCLSAASGILGLLLPYGFELLAPNLPILLRVAQISGFALPWMVYVLFRIRFAQSAVTAEDAKQQPMIQQSPADKSSATGQHKAITEFVNIIGVLRIAAIVFCVLVAGYLVLVVGIMACCSR